MTNNNSKNDFDELDHDMTFGDLSSNKRISVRYRRRDIKAVVKIRRLFFSSQFPVTLVDIGSKGAAVESDKKLKPKSRVTLTIEFTDEKSFDISATIVHDYAAPRYGLKFDSYQNELAEHLLETQTDLEFG